MSDKKQLTTAGGAPGPDNQNVMTTGPADRCCCRTCGSWRSSPTSIAR